MDGNLIDDVNAELTEAERDREVRILARKLRESGQVEFTFEALNEDTGVRGNALASGNDAEDKRAEDEILERLNRGDLAAWFTAKVTASFGGIESSDHLGCCSYTSFRDFENCETMADMEDQALYQLASEIVDLQLSLAEIGIK